MNKRIFAVITLLIIASYSVFLYATDKLGLYIHPRFFEEALIAGVIGIAISCIYLFTIIKQNKFSVPKELLLLTFVLLGIFVNLIFLLFGIFIAIKYLSNKKLSSSNFFILGFLGLMIFIPPTSLSSFTATQRVTNLSNLNLSNQNRKLVNSFTSNTESLGLGDWIASFTYNPDNSYYVGKKVKVSGFMFRTPEITNDDFIAARFVIACCAVDARPVGLTVKNVDNFEFIKDRWVEVSGEFIEESNALKILPNEIKYIDQPDDPYIF